MIMELNSYVEIFRSLKEMVLIESETVNNLSHLCSEEEIFKQGSLNKTSKTRGTRL